MAHALKSARLDSSSKPELPEGGGGLVRVLLGHIEPTHPVTHRDGLQRGAAPAARTRGPRTRALRSRTAGARARALAGTVTRGYRHAGGIARRTASRVGGASPGVLLRERVDDLEEDLALVNREILEPLDVPQPPHAERQLLDSAVARLLAAEERVRRHFESVRDLDENLGRRGASLPLVVRDDALRDADLLAELRLRQPLPEAALLNPVAQRLGRGRRFLPRHRPSLGAVLPADGDRA
jgi:hypothetical protein